MNKFNKIYEELQGNVVDNSKLTDKEMLRLAITEEYKAINLYEQMADNTKNKKIKDVMLDIAKEEKIHIGEFKYLLSQIDNEHEKALIDGAKEVK